MNVQLICLLSLITSIKMRQELKDIINRLTDVIIIKMKGGVEWPLSWDALMT